MLKTFMAIVLKATNPPKAVAKVIDKALDLLEAVAELTDTRLDDVVVDVLQFVTGTEGSGEDRKAIVNNLERAGREIT